MGNDSDYEMVEEGGEDEFSEMRSDGKSFKSNQSSKHAKKKMVRRKKKKVGDKKVVNDKVV